VCELEEASEAFAVNNPTAFRKVLVILSSGVSTGMDALTKKAKMTDEGASGIDSDRLPEAYKEVLALVRALTKHLSTSHAVSNILFNTDPIPYVCATALNCSHSPSSALHRFSLELPPPPHSYISLHPHTHTHTHTHTHLPHVPRHLVQVLEVGADDMAKLLAAESLFELARHSTEHCDTIFRCNGLNSLLVLLRTGSSFSQTRAAGALKAMLKDSQKRQAAFAEGVPFSCILCPLPSLSHTLIHSTPSRNLWHSSVRNPHSDQPQRVLLLCFLSLLRVCGLNVVQCEPHKKFHTHACLLCRRWVPCSCSNVGEERRGLGYARRRAVGDVSPRHHASADEH
jgi:hypothetical protein